MKKAIVTVGLGYGDEGKGATVDYLCRKHNADLVVRYSGGCQAAHHVYLPNGKSHRFSQWGSGTLVGARTYLDRNVIVDPITMALEASCLKDHGLSSPFSMLFVHPQCLVTTVYHMLVNQLTEERRGNRRHGSCGFGIGVTRKYRIDHGSDAIVVNDIFRRERLIDKLMLLRDRLCEAHPEFVDCIRRYNPYNVALKLAECLRCHVADMPETCTAVFEGAQGVLLDQYVGEMPHCTHSVVTTHHADELLDELGVEDRTYYGIIRSYMTRHGHGPLRGELPTDMIPRRWTDEEDNYTNNFQGCFRYARGLDVPLIQHSIKNCGHELDGLVVNHMDFCRDHIGLIGEDGTSVTLTPITTFMSGECLGTPIAITGHGKTHQHRMEAAT